MSENKGRKPTVEEAEAILTLVRGGWLELELDLSSSEDERVPQSEGA